MVGGHHSHDFPNVWSRRLRRARAEQASVRPAGETQPGAKRPAGRRRALVEADSRWIVASVQLQRCARTHLAGWGFYVVRLWRREHGGGGGLRLAGRPSQALAPPCSYPPCCIDHAVTTAENGAQALELLRSSSPGTFHLVLTVRPGLCQCMHASSSARPWTPRS